MVRSSPNVIDGWNIPARVSKLHYHWRTRSSSMSQPFLAARISHPAWRCKTNVFPPAEFRSHALNTFAILSHKIHTKHNIVPSYDGGTDISSCCIDGGCSSVSVFVPRCVTARHSTTRTVVPPVFFQKFIPKVVASMRTAPGSCGVFDAL